MRITKRENLFLTDSSLLLLCLLLDLRRLHDELYAAGISVVQAAEGLVVFARLLDGFQAADYVAQAGAQVVGKVVGVFIAELLHAVVEFCCTIVEFSQALVHGVAGVVQLGAAFGQGVGPLADLANRFYVGVGTAGQLSTAAGKLVQAGLQLADAAAKLGP